MTATWKRLIRFVAQDGKIYRGEPIVSDAEYDVGKQFLQGKLIKMIGIFRRNSKKINVGAFVKPFKQAANWRITVVILAASVTFAYANIVLIVEMPQTFGAIFELSPQALGLHYIALIVGSCIGEGLAGPLSDWWMARSIKKRNGQRVIADRLFISYNGYLLVIVGLVVWGVYLDLSLIHI